MNKFSASNGVEKFLLFSQEMGTDKRIAISKSVNWQKYRFPLGRQNEQNFFDSQTVSVTLPSISQNQHTVFFLKILCVELVEEMLQAKVSSKWNFNQEKKWMWQLYLCVHWKKKHER